jgi:hypothetical protein
VVNVPQGVGAFVPLGKAPQCWLKVIEILNHGVCKNSSYPTRPVVRTGL